MEWLLSCMNEDGANSYIPLSKQFGAESAMNRNIVKLISLLAILALFSVWAFGQAESGAIDGTVTDKTGAVVVGAKVTATSIDTGLVRTTTTKSAGEYTITNLPPKTYDVTIEAPGFQKYTQRVKVGVGSMNDVSAKLAVTGASTTVEVTGSAEVAVVNTESQTLSEVVNSKQLEGMPTLTRNPYDLVGISGNVVADPTGSGRGAGFNINGQRNDSTDILLDGAENVDLFTASIGQSVPLDSVQEFSVLTNNFSAEYGRASGGIVNVATKSGTNAFHGSVYEFNRVAALASNTYNNDATRAGAFADGTCVVGQPCAIGQKGGFTRNQFGYSVGGPIIKNKLFFFSSTEWTRVRSNATVSWGITDPAFLALPVVSSQTKGYFSKYGALRSGVNVISKTDWGTACPQTLGSDGTPLFPQCIIPGLTGSSPFGESVQYNAPADSGGGLPQNTYSTVARIDYNWTDKTTIYGRYALYSENDFSGTVNNSPYVGYDTGQTTYDQNVNLSLTHVFTPNFVSSSKINYNRLNGPVQPLGTAPVTPGLFSTGSVPALPGTNNQYIFPGYVQNSTANAIPFGGPQNLYELYEDLSWTKGRHQFKFGGSYIQTRDNRVFGAYENAVQILGSNFTNGLANLVAGQTYQFQGALYPQGKFPCSKNSNGVLQQTPDCTLNLPATEPAFNRNNRYNDGSMYVNDSWKVTPRLTLNLGLRWEYYGVQHNANPSLDSNFYLGSGSTFQEQIRNGSVQIADKSPVGGLWAQDKDNFAPRVGFAWDIFGDGSTSLRGGYGWGYERNFGNVTFNVIQNPPNYAVISITSGIDVPTQPIYLNNIGAFGGTGTAPIPNVTLRTVRQDIPTAYTQFWSMAVDRQLMRNSVLSVAYSGAKGSDLYDIGNINTQYFGSTYLGDTHLSNRLNYQYGNINYRGNEGASLYNAVNVKFSTSNLFNKGLQLVANYTWAHSIDNQSSTFTDGYNGNYGLGYTNYFNPNYDRGNSDFDVRQRFVVSAVWDLPWMKNASSAFARQALGGWSLSPIISVHSGYPYNIYDGTNGLTINPRWIPGGPVPASGHNNGPVAPNQFNYLPMPVDPATGLAAGVGNALQVPTQGLAKTADGVGIFCQNYAGASGSGAFSCNGAGITERNQTFGPGYWNADFLVTKQFKLTERFNLQFRSEFYNIFNHSNLYINSNLLDLEYGATFIQAQKGGIYGNPGQPTDERRNIQFALKLLF